jgi:Mn-dependent DtxR family transcriptional regulator
MALLSSISSYRHLFAGLTNKSLRELVAGLIPGYTARQMTYDLRRLRRKGLIRRIPKSQRYELTDHGRRTAVFFTKTYTRILNPSLTELDPQLPDEIAQRLALARAWRAFEQALEARIAEAHLTPA